MFQMRYFLVALVCYSVLSIPNSGSAQTFRGGMLVGINFSQIDGDNIYGYRKIGLLGGVTVRTSLHPRWDIALEMLYDQQGSSVFTAFTNPKDPGQIILDYVSFPLIFKYKDWMVERREGAADFYRFEFDMGLQYGRAFRILGGGFPITDFLSKHFFGVLLGGQYFFTPYLAGQVRYTQAFWPIHRYEDGDLIRNVIPYKIHFALVYMP